MRSDVAFRHQVTLFAPGPIAGVLNALRAQLDPVQHGLIGAHVTLCRDAETGAMDAVAFAARIEAARRGPVVLTFGAAEVFDGHGLRLPCLAGEAAFADLRARFLGGEAIRREAPHITLAHPRNPKAPGNTLERARRLRMPLTLAFGTATLITKAPDAPWRAVAAAAL